MRSIINKLRRFLEASSGEELFALLGALLYESVVGKVKWQEWKRCRLAQGGNKHVKEYRE